MSDEKTTAEPSGASAGSRGEQCRCNLRTRLVGDGCEHCNPEMMIDILREQIAEMQLTDEEREVLESLVSVGRLYSPKRNAEVIQGLLDRLK